MPYISDIEELAIEEGIQKGIKKGIERGQLQATTRVALALLQRRFGSLSDEVRTEVEALELPQAEQLTLALLDFRSVEDLSDWLRTSREP
jgi:flagellar biosynthesis/type III secretory pathway protein FliH